jgi:RTX calcium-binding nonapeptide repeat (4 copies)
VKRFSLASLITVAALMAAPSGAGAATGTSMVGQNFLPSGGFCGDHYTVLQTGASSGNPYTVPTAGVITSWSFQLADNAIPGLKLKVARPQLGGSYLFVGEAAAGPQTPNAINTYPANIAVQAGDVIGIRWNSADFVPCFLVTDNLNDHQVAFSGDAAVGTAPAPLGGAVGGARYPVAAAVTTTTPDTAPGTEPPTCKGQSATIVGTDRNDVRSGTPGRDVIVGQGGNDTLFGLAGDDVICGGAGKDKLNGGPGNDSLLGQSGKDKLKGGGGADLCKGGKGKDTASACEVKK